jgi:hypothetical protein
MIESLIIPVAIHTAQVVFQITPTSHPIERTGKIKSNPMTFNNMQAKRVKSKGLEQVPGPPAADVFSNIIGRMFCCAAQPYDQARADVPDFDIHSSQNSVVDPYDIRKLPAKVVACSKIAQPFYSKSHSQENKSTSHQNMHQVLSEEQEGTFVTTSSGSSDQSTAIMSRIEFLTTGAGGPVDMIRPVSSCSTATTAAISCDSTEDDLSFFSLLFALRPKN